MTTYWSWSEFPFDWKKCIVYCIAGPRGIFLGTFYHLLSWFHQCVLDTIICIWTIYPVLAASDSKFRQLVHAWFIHQTLIKPLLHARTLLGTLHTVFQVLTTLKGTVIIPISQVWNWGYLRLSYFPKITQGSEQELHGLPGLGAYTLPPCPMSQGSQLSPDLHFWHCMGFNLVSLIGIKYFWLWK